jgi:uncharacterized protein
MPDLDPGPLSPAHQFVLKVHSRCDLACDHCYVYEGADQSWRGRPTVISSDVVSQTAMRVAEHVKAHGLSRVEIVAHGGEPLLAGVTGLRRIFSQLQAELGGLCQVDLKVHTNGVRLSEEFCQLFADYGVTVGISLDGDRKANDRHRLYRDGRSSYDAAVRAVRLLSGDRYRHVFAGLLCTIDVSNDPVTVYESLLELDPPRVDFLLPHATWDAPPARAAGDASGTQYADWLIAIFEKWQADGYPVRIRTFDSIIAMLAGEESSTEALGLAPVRTVVIETDGTYEQADSLKVAFEGAAATGLDVFTHSLDAVVGHRGVAARQRGVTALSKACQQCPVVTVCGGGMYAHRYRSGSGFDNPSVYCGDLRKLIEHIAARLPHVAAHKRGPDQAISERALGEFAAGLGGASALNEIGQSQRSFSRGLVTAVYDQVMAANAVSVPVKEQVRAAWRTLAAADGSSPDAVAVVLGHPYLRAWAVRCLERLGAAASQVGPGRGQATGTAGAAATAVSAGLAVSAGPGSLAGDLAHLGSIAAAAAIRAQARASVTVPVRAGAVHLPGLGRLVTGLPDGQAALEVDDDWVRVHVEAHEWRLPRSRLLAVAPCVGPDGWEPVRVLTAPGIRVVLDDIDPYRNCHQGAVTTRMPDQEFARWQESFARAWHEIRHRYADYAAGIATGLAVLTPLSPEPVSPEPVLAEPGRSRGGSGNAVRHASGAVGVALSAEPLALELMREFQREKVRAIFDLFDLFDPTGERPYQVSGGDRPWQLEEMLEGGYAQLAECEFWRVRARLGGPDRERAREQYARSRRHLADVVATLAASGCLTRLGARFVDGMRNAISVTPDALLCTLWVVGLSQCRPRARLGCHAVSASITRQSRPGPVPSPAREVVTRWRMGPPLSAGRRTGPEYSGPMTH